MNISENGITLIKQFEGLCLKAYKCVSTETYYTIGYGHYGADVKKNATITKEDAEILLRSDMPTYESKVNKYDNVYKFNQNEFDALVSFAYNVGSVDQLTNKGKRTRTQIANAMLAYNKSGGVVLSGLTKRRQKEKELFEMPIESDADVSTSKRYYKCYDGNSTKVDEVLTAIGVPSKYVGSYKKRSTIAAACNMSNYKGSATQNLKIISLAKTGKIPVVD